MNIIYQLTQGVRTVVVDVARGMYDIAGNGLALLGLGLVFGAGALVADPQLLQAGEARLMGMLHQRQIATTPQEPQGPAVERATAADPKDLPQQQAAITFWLSKKYRVAPEPLSALVMEAYEVGGRRGLDPALLLAVMAVDSGFNPFAQSPVGGQGLMQLATRSHAEKYLGFGGDLAAFDPVTNLRVGAVVLQDAIIKAGSVGGGLKLYLASNPLNNDLGYSNRVLAERDRLLQVAAGRVPRPAVPTGLPVKALPAPVPSEKQVTAPLDYT